MKILLLDNNGESAVGLVGAFSAAGIETSEAGNISTAKAMCGKTDFDFAVITDYRPPADTIADLMETDNSLRFIIVASKPDWKDAAAAVGKNNVAAYMAAPPDAAEILLLLNSAAESNSRNTLPPEISDKISNAPLQMVLDSAQIGTWDVDLTTGRVTNNENWAKLFGYTLEEIEPTLDFWLSRIHPDDLQDVLDSMEKDINSSGGVFEKEYRVKCRKGEWKWIMSRGMVTERDPSGRPLRHCGVCIDIADRKKMEQEIAGNVSHLQTIISNMPVMMDAFDDNITPVAWNRECERVTGYSAAEIIGNPRVLEILYPDPDYRKKLNDKWAQLGGDFFNWESEVTCKDGSFKTISWTNISKKFPVPGWSTWALGFDVTEKSRMERELRKMKGQLQQRQKMETVGMLAGSTALEFNNFLAVIVGSASLAMSKIAKSNMLYDDLKSIMDSCFKASALVDHLLSFTGKEKLNRARINISDLIKTTVASARKSCPEGIIFEIVSQRELSPVKLDPAQVKLAISNILTNSIEAMPDGGTITISTDVAPPDGKLGSIYSHLDPGEFYRINISDTGIGIPPHVIGRVTEPFYSTWKPGRGVGLGLSVALGIIERHDGAMFIESGPGPGTVVEIYLPFSPKLNEAEKDIIDIPRGNETILVVDDHEDARAVAGSILAQAGYMVLTASDRDNAVNMFARGINSISAIVLDLVQPDEYSMEILPKLIALSPEVRILITTDYNSREPWKELAGMGLSHILKKPYTNVDLCTRLRVLLDE